MTLARILTALDPALFSHTSIFLAGSINNGASFDWQATVIQRLSHLPDLDIYNPRRSDWNPNLAEEDERGLRAQIRWELAHIREADLVFFYFDEVGLSPVSMLELVFRLPAFIPRNKRENLIVTAHLDTPRRANLSLTLADFGYLLHSFDRGLELLRQGIKNRRGPQE